MFYRACYCYVERQRITVKKTIQSGVNGVSMKWHFPCILGISDQQLNKARDNFLSSVMHVSNVVLLFVISLKRTRSQQCTE